MLWPERPDVWREHGRPAQMVFAEIAGTIAQYETVWMGVSAESFTTARAKLPPSVNLVQVEYNDAWMRDNGPTIVINDDGERRGIDWDFNAWGGLYEDFLADDQLAKKVLGFHQFGRYKAPLVMEGGAIDVDGQGSLIVTEQCLLNPNRNPSLDKLAIETHLKAYLSVEKVIWLQNGVFNDETSGHVDNLCCFVRPGVVALTWCDDENDPQYAISQAAYEVLTSVTDNHGRQLEVHKIAQPKPIYISAEEAAGIKPLAGSIARPENQRLAGSYINYYVGNGFVIVPQFDDPNDKIALEKFAALFPNRKIIGIYAREILLGGGNIHCITQQIPTHLQPR